MKLEEHLDAEPDLKKLILAIADVSKKIQASFTGGSEAAADTKNIYGETQMELDVWADKTVIDALRNTGLVKSIATEEQDDVVHCDAGKFSVVVDPLDGSENIRTGLPLGSIFGIYAGESVLQPGRDMVAALYILYGRIPLLVVTTGKGVHEYVLSVNDYVLQNENLTIPDGKIYVPSGTKEKWMPEFEKFLRRMEEMGNKIRNHGCMVADFHMALKLGGIYTYPGLKGKPEGKIRLLFECNPMSFIAEKAGGEGSDGKQNILDIVPEKIQQRTPIFLGTKTLVEEAKRCYV